MRSGLYAVLFALGCLLLFAVGYWLNLPGMHDLAASLGDGIGQFLRVVGLFVGVLVSCATLIGVAFAYVEWDRRRKITVIGPGKHGYKQAVIHRGELIQLAQPNQSQMDPLQQIAYMQKVIQLSKYAQPTRVQEVEAASVQQIEGPSTLPTNINYADIRSQVPKGHILVGIGRKGIETKERAVGACLWIVGLSGTGKTSTTVLRVEERAAAGHRFMGADPHWFKPDSLTNAIKAYRSLFILPMAQTPEDTNRVFKAFMTEFQARKAGKVAQPWQPITLIVDEVGALMDPTNEIEEENAKMLPSIARVCGQEARNFEMGGIFISQQATGLSWLRKVALMVIVHQLLQESEKKLATNNDTAVMLDMKTWPIGRTYVFGVGFQEGPRTVQQPRFSVPDVIESTLEPSSENFQAQQWEENREAPGSAQSDDTSISDLRTIKILREIGKRLKAGEQKAEIVKSFGLPYGRATQEISAVVDMVASEQMEAKG